MESAASNNSDATTSQSTTDSSGSPAEEGSSEGAKGSSLVQNMDIGEERPLNKRGAPMREAAKVALKRIKTIQMHENTWEKIDKLEMIKHKRARRASRKSTSRKSSSRASTSTSAIEKEQERLEQRWQQVAKEMSRPETVKIDQVENEDSGFVEATLLEENEAESFVDAAQHIQARCEEMLEAPPDEPLTDSQYPLVELTANKSSETVKVYTREATKQKIKRGDLEKVVGVKLAEGAFKDFDDNLAFELRNGGLVTEEVVKKLNDVANASEGPADKEQEANEEQDESYGRRSVVVLKTRETMRWNP